MPNRVYLSEALLQPVRPEQPGGRDLRFEPVFSEILEARRSDDVTGKLPQWDVVAELSLEALQISKDIRLCCFLTEAGIFLDGFPGLAGLPSPHAGDRYAVSGIRDYCR